MEYTYSGLENRISAEHLKAGEVIKVTGKGQSMTPILKSGQPVICVPVTDKTLLDKRDIVLCKVNGHYYLHLIWSLKPGDRFLIGNNHNHPNGVISRKNIFGKVVEIL